MSEVARVALPGASPLRCPVPRCRADNPGGGERCHSCGTPLRSYARLLAQASRLFNLGLAEARQGRLRGARDLFAAVVHWCPHDLEARGALGLASLQLGDATAARSQFESMIARSPDSVVARKGLEALGRLAGGQDADLTKPRERGDRSGRRRARRRGRRSR